MFTFQTKPSPNPILCSSSDSPSLHLFSLVSSLRPPPPLLPPPSDLRAAIRLLHSHPPLHRGKISTDLLQKYNVRSMPVRNLSVVAGFRTSSDAGATASELKDAFDLYDQNKNGLISSAELHQVLTRLGMSCSVDDCVKMIKSVDSDGDGCVNFDEFKQMMASKIKN